MTILTFANRAVFENGAILKLPKEMKRCGMQKPLIVTDNGIRDAGLLEKLLSVLDSESALPVFDKTPGNPTETAVLIALAQYQNAGCDSVIAFGGGSSMDLGKAVAMLAGNGGPLERFDPLAGGSREIRHMPPVIAIPTTSGTGSEVSVGSVIILEDGRKMTFASPKLVPPVAICDPELTLGLPAYLTAATGMDAVTHCIESVLSPVVNPPADGIGLDALERAWKWLPIAVEDGANLEARWHMMMASTEAAYAFIKGLGAVHAMSHAAGRLPDLTLHHGTLNAVLLPAVLRFNLSACEPQYRRLAQACGLQQPEQLADAILALNIKLGLPANLSEMGVTENMLDELVRYSEMDMASRTNPVPVSAEDYRRLFQQSL